MDGAARAGMCVHNLCRVATAEVRSSIRRGRAGGMLLACLLMLCVGCTGRGGYEDVLLPRPQMMRLTGGNLSIKNEKVRNTDFGSRNEQSGIGQTDIPSSVFRFHEVDSIAGAEDYTLHGYPSEAYRLRVTSDSIVVEYVTAVGRLRAMQTLVQLREGAGGRRIPCCEITDWPAFKLRGWMHDVGRSFISIDELRREIALMARFKVNTFHWHLTENQAWRLQVSAFPQLTADTSMTRFAGQYYTQQQCRELEAFAAERGITLIPEVDMPGHSAAFERAMGHPMTSPEGREELKVILREVMETFPLAPYIHIGGDETAVTAELLQEMADVVHVGGKRVVTWNPIRTAISPTFSDMTQLWSTAGRALPGIPAIDCRYNYVNHFDVFADLVGIWKSSIYYRKEGSADLAGTITAVWNDRKLPTEADIIRQNNLYANVLASAERAWCGGGEQYIEQGGTRLPDEGAEYEAFADWERRFLFHKAHSLRGEPIPYVRQANVRWRIADPAADTSCRWTGAGIYLSHTWNPIVPTGWQGNGDTAFAWTYVHSPRAQEAGALIEFHNYGRSERDLAPDSGHWDRMGSRIWLNDTELPPPVWTGAGKPVTNETDMGNENFTARPPYPIRLRSGWNKVCILLPYNHPQGIRKPKWMFTFVITDTEGLGALDGLRYDPDARPQPKIFLKE